jgi:hypothetical protein
LNTSPVNTEIHQRARCSERPGGQLVARVERNFVAERDLFD